MQHNPRLQPLTLHHVTRGQQEGAETWSSDSDSGITVDSHSPPARAAHTPHNHPPPPPLKTTPDSGIGLEDPPSWDFPPPPPSFLSDVDPPVASAITMTSAVAPRGVSGAPIAGLGSRDEDERRRQQQDYVRNTLLEYERQKRLQEQQQQRRSSSSQEDALYDHNDILEALDNDATVEKSYSSGDRDTYSHRHATNPLTTSGQRPKASVEGSYAANRTAHTDRTAHRTQDMYSGRSREDPNDFYSANSAKNKLSKFYGSKEDRDLKAKNVNNGGSSTDYRSTSLQSRGGYNKPLPPPPPLREGRAEDRGLHGLAGSSRRAIPNDYVPSRLVDKLRHSGDVMNDHDVSDCGLQEGDGYRDQRQYGEDLQQCRVELSKKLVGAKREGDERGEEGGGVREGGADDGYGTADSRSITTTATSSLASPLSSSLSSITTDSSSSLNGSQRLPASAGGGNGTGNTGSARVQPVPSGGRLVVGRRPMLVKRRDLPPVEIRSEYGASLEERLRALTTIEEEDPNNPSPASVLSHPKSPPLPPRKDERPDPARSLPTDAHYRPRSGSGSGSRSGQDDDEGPYCSIQKKQPARPTSAPMLRRPLPGGAGSGHGGSALDQAHRESDPSLDSKNPATERERAGSTGSVHSVHRAVPVRVEPEGAAFLPARQDSGGERCDDGSNAPGPIDSEKTEVRFKAGGAGVKLTDAGQFEIDYSYYMKATPSESNDEVNTYSPDQSKADIDVEVFHEGVEGGGGANVQWDQRPTGSTGYQPPPSGRGSQGDGYYSGRTTPSSGSRATMEYGADQGQVYRPDRHAMPRSGGGDSSLRQGGVMSSMPNLSLQPPPRRHSGDSDYYRQPPSRRHSGDVDYQESSREVHDVQGELGQPPPYRRNPTPGSGYLGARRTGQGERNSCDVGSLYRQADLSQTFPPAQGVANDRLSLNLGDLPRIHEQLRATSEMLLSTGKRHQFASSSDIYRLFQGQQQQRQQALGFAQGRQPTHRHSFHNFNSAQQPMQNLADVRSRVRAGNGVVDQSQGATSPTAGLHVQGPVRADHNIVVPDSGGYSQYGGRDTRQMYPREGNGSPRDVNVSPRDVSLSPRDVTVSPRDVSVSPRDMHSYTKHAGLSPRLAAQPPARDMQGGGRTTPSFRERLSRGEQYSTDIIQDQDGEKLSTLV